MGTDPKARIVTVPNLISVVRLACAPVFVWLLADDELLAAAALLAFLGASDWIDGWIARRFDQGSDLGKVLDPVADRILLLVAAVALIVQGSVPLVVGILVLAREAVVSVAVLALAAAGAGGRRPPGPARRGGGAGRGARGGGARRPPHRRSVGGQGGHPRTDVRLPPPPLGRRHQRHRERRRARRGVVHGRVRARPQLL